MKSITVIIVLVLTACITSCSQNNSIDEGTNQEGVSTESSSLPEPTVTEFHNTDPLPINLFYPMQTDKWPAEAEIEDWEKYMLDKNNLIINLVYTDIIDRGDLHFEQGISHDTGVILESLLDMTESDGFIYLRSFDDVVKLSKSGLIQPVNQAYDGISILSVLNDNIKEMHTDSTGNIWAIPLTDSIYFESRAYNQSWLEAYGKPIPTTLDGFYEYAKFIAGSDPDGNTKKDTCIMNYTNQSVLDDFTDIFRAFGCYTRQNDPIAYNPNKRAFELIVQNNNFIEAMTFIKLLKDEGLVRNSQINSILMSASNEKERTELEKEYPDWDEKTYLPATIYGYNKGFNRYTDVKFSFYIEGTNKKNLMDVRGDANAVVVLAGTKDSSEKIYQLLNFITGPYTNMLDLREGMEGYKYYEKDEYIDIKSTDPEGRTIRGIGIYCGFYNPNADFKPVIVDGDLSLLNSYNNIDEDVSGYFTKSLEYLESDKVYSIPFDYRNSQISGLNVTIYEETTELFHNILDLGKSIEDSIDVYLNSLESKGVINEVENININTN